MIAIDVCGCGISEETILAWMSRDFVWILCTLSIGGRANGPELPGKRSSPKMCRQMQAVENFPEKEPLEKKSLLCDLEPGNFLGRMGQKRHPPPKSQKQSDTGRVVYSTCCSYMVRNCT